MMKDEDGRGSIRTVRSGDKRLVVEPMSAPVVRHVSPNQLFRKSAQKPALSPLWRGGSSAATYRCVTMKLRAPFGWVRRYGPAGSGRRCARTTWFPETTSGRPSKTSREDKPQAQGFPPFMSGNPAFAAWSSKVQYNARKRRSCGPVSS